jgi:subtilisin family serine protease
MIRIGRYGGPRFLLLAFAIGAALVPTGARAQPPPAAAQTISPQAAAQIRTLLDEKLHRSRFEAKINSRLLHAARVARGAPVASELSNVRITLPMTSDNRVALDVRGPVTRGLLDRLTALGATVTDSDSQYDHIGVTAPLSAVESIAALDEVRQVLPDYGWMIQRSAVPNLSDLVAPPARSRLLRDLHQRARLVGDVRAAVAARLQAGGSLLNTGTVTSQGDITHRAVDARSAFNTTGAGIKIGVLSDGVNSLATSQASGNLGPVTVLAPGSGDEGTAMLEIIADLAPGAQLFFATADGGPTVFAQHIRDLRDAGCDIIVDDVLYFVETPFQDGQVSASDTNGGVIIQAVKDVAASGALYFSSAGNSGGVDAGTSGTWEGDFLDGGAVSGPIASIEGGLAELHNFGTAGAPAAFDTLLTSGGAFNTLFWSDPLGASNNDYDLFLLDSTGSNVLDFSIDAQTGSQDPFEAVGGGSAGDRLVIVKYSGQNRFLHLSTNRGTLSLATSGEVHGHAATSAVNSFAVAATPACLGFNGNNGPCTSSFTSANRVETFSSDGPRRIFFTADGGAITPDLSATGGQVLLKPDITAADGVSTSVSGFTSFYGTSAAAPHAAAIAALVRAVNLQQVPAVTAATLLATSIDVQAAGWDRDSGAGIVMAYQAVAAVAPPAVPPPPTGLSITRTGPTSAVAMWDPVAGVTLYAVKAGFVAGGPKSLLGYSLDSSAQVPVPRGQRLYIAVATANGNGTSADSTEVSYFAPLVDNPEDVDGDGAADIAVWRPGTGEWFWETSGTGFNPSLGLGATLGLPTDRPFVGDIDGDGRADPIVWRSGSGTWSWLLSSAGYNNASQGSKDWGITTDVPLVGDLDGDGRVDLIVWRPSTGTWYWLLSSTGYDATRAGSVQWGIGSLGDIPMTGDFDGDGKADIAVWRPTDGTFYWLNSSMDYSRSAAGSMQWGIGSLGDVPLLGDLDGDGRADLVVWRPADGTFYWLYSSLGYSASAAGSQQWGVGSLGDLPRLADLDGDGRADLVVWRPATGKWYWLTSSSGYNPSAAGERVWGTSGDVPMIR